MTAALQVGIVVAYLVLALGVGVLAFRVTERRAEDYFLASRTFGTVVLLFTVFATLLSAFTFFGGPNTAYLHGPEWILVMGLMDGILFAILWYVVGFKQWVVGKRHGHVTLGETLGARFGSTGLRALVAVVSLAWLFPYVMLQQIGAGTALVGLTEGAVPFWAGAALVTFFMILYVVIAGIRGIAWTDTLQGLFMLVMLWAAFVWVLVAVGGPTAATGRLSEVAPEFLALGSDFYTPQRMLTFAISIAFGVSMFPQVNQRFFTAGSETVLRRSLALWPILVVLLFVPAFLLGAWGRGLVEVDVAAGENVLSILLAEYTPAWFAALVVAGAIAAMMSSSDSMLLSGSSYFTRDVYRPIVDDELSERGEDLLGRVGVIVFAVAALVASLFVGGQAEVGVVGDVLVDIGDTAFGGFAQLALPVILALYWRGVTRDGFVAAVVLSQAAYVSGVLLPTHAELPVVGTVRVGLAETYFGWGVSLYCMVLGLIVTVAVSYITSRRPSAEPSVFFGNDEPSRTEDRKT